MFVISVNPGNLIQRAVQANMNSGGKVELDMHAPPTTRKMWIPAGGILPTCMETLWILHRCFWKALPKSMDQDSSFLVTAHSTCLIETG